LETTLRPLLFSWLLALMAGIGLGLFLAWYVLPVSYTEAQPYDLNGRDKDDYLRMIASSYALDNSFELARQRLYYLQLANTQARLAELARAETNPLTQQALVKLRLGLDQPARAAAQPSFTPHPTPNRIPAARVTVVVLVPTQPLPTAVPPTPLPTAMPPTSEPNPNAPQFELKEIRALDCAAVGGGAALRVDVLDTAGNGLPGIAVEVNSDLGNELFYTGLKPEKGLGYGDVQVVPGVYSVHLVENAASSPVGDLRIESNVVECGSTPPTTQGWHLVFRQVSPK
jgi:hypothetical protein